MNALNGFELKILDGIQDLFQCGFLDWFMPIITKLGDGGIFWIIIAVLLLLTKKYRKVGAMMGVALLLGLLVGNITLKPLIDRIRPYEMSGVNFELLVEPLSDGSFPSGHTLACFEAATVLLINKRKFGIPAMCIALNVAFSRLYLYVHYPTDVLAGMLLGIGFGVNAVVVVNLLIKVFSKKRQKKREHKEKLNNRKRLLLIVNPVSGKMTAKDALVEVIKELQKKQLVVTVRLTEKRGHAVEFASTAVADGYDSVACFGGDGTLNETICGLMQSNADLPLGYIPAGSTNDFAASMNLSSDPKEASEIIATGDEYPIDIGCFNGDRYFTYVASFGAFTAASYNVPQGVKNVLGHFAYILGGVKEVASIRSYSVTVELDDRTVSGDYIFVSVTNTTSVGGVVKLKEELVDMSDGVFEVALIKKPKSIADLSHIITAITTSNFNNGGIEFYKSSKAKIITEGKLDWTLDGEHAESDGEVVIENMNHAVKFIR